VDALTKPVSNKRESYRMYSKELVGVIRKIAQDKIDLEYLPDLALIACREIERLAAELKEAELRMNNSYYRSTQPPYRSTQPPWK
jgi:hypothetical protein